MIQIFLMILLVDELFELVFNQEGNLLQIWCQSNFYTIFSIKHSSKTALNCAADAPPMEIKPDDKDFTIIYTYSIEWQVW
jgi:hypothetical protein